MAPSTYNELLALPLTGKEIKKLFEMEQRGQKNQVGLGIIHSSFRQPNQTAYLDPIHGLSAQRRTSSSVQEPRRQERIKHDRLEILTSFVQLLSRQGPLPRRQYTIRTRMFASLQSHRTWARFMVHTMGCSPRCVNLHRYSDSTMRNIPVP